MSACMYVCTYVCLYVCVYMNVCMRMCVCMYVCTHISIYICVYVLSGSPVLRGVERWFSEKEVVVFWFASHVLKHTALPQLLHVVPVLNQTMLDRVIDLCVCVHKVGKCVIGGGSSEGWYIQSINQSINQSIVVVVFVVSVALTLMA
jgi:hypothetical protein